MRSAMSPLRSDPETEDLLAPLEIGGMLAARAASFAQRAASFNYRAKLVATLRGKSKQSAKRVVQLLLADAMRASEGLGRLAVAARTALTLTQMAQGPRGRSAEPVKGGAAHSRGPGSPDSVSSRRSQRSDVTSPSRARLVSLLATPPRVSARLLPKDGKGFRPGSHFSGFRSGAYSGEHREDMVGKLGLGIRAAGGSGGGSVSGAQLSQGDDSRGHLRALDRSRGGQTRRQGTASSGRSRQGHSLRRSPRLRCRTARSRAQAMAARRKAEAEAR